MVGHTALRRYGHTDIRTYGHTDIRTYGHTDCFHTSKFATHLAWSTRRSTVKWSCPAKAPRSAKLRGLSSGKCASAAVFFGPKGAKEKRGTNFKKSHWPNISLRFSSFRTATQAGSIPLSQCWGQASIRPGKRGPGAWVLKAVTREDQVGRTAKTLCPHAPAFWQISSPLSSCPFTCTAKQGTSHPREAMPISINQPTVVVAVLPPNQENTAFLHAHLFGQILEELRAASLQGSMQAFQCTFQCASRSNQACYNCPSMSRRFESCGEETNHPSCHRPWKGAFSRHPCSKAVMAAF